MNCREGEEARSSLTIKQLLEEFLQVRSERLKDDYKEWKRKRLLFEYHNDNRAKYGMP